MEHQLLRFFNPGIQDLIPGFLRFLQDSFIWIANLRLMVGLGRAECGWYSRSQLTEEVSGIRSVAGAFAICLAHDPLFADLVLSVVSIHVALLKKSNHFSWSDNSIYHGTSIFVYQFSFPVETVTDAQVQLCSRVKRSNWRSMLNSDRRENRTDPIGWQLRWWPFHIQQTFRWTWESDRFGVSALPWRWWRQRRLNRRRRLWSRGNERDWSAARSSLSRLPTSWTGVEPTKLIEIEKDKRKKEKTKKKETNETSIDKLRRMEQNTQKRRTGEKRRKCVVVDIYICRLFGQNGHISFVLATQETSQKGTQQALDISTMI